MPERQGKRIKSISLAIIAAILYGVSTPVSKLLLVEIPPALMAALLYLGAGFGMSLIYLTGIWTKKERPEAKMTKKDLPYIIGMIALDIAAPILLMIGLSMSASENVSLLNNFEIVATSLIALMIFKETIGRRLWVAIILITISSVILSISDFRSLSFSAGSIFVIAACLCWGFENNFTRMLSLKDPVQIVIVKGFGAGTSALMISIAVKQFGGSLLYVLIALLLGFVAYGLSIYFYINAQRELGAARTSAYYAAAPFIGVMISWLVLREGITSSFFIALVIMLAGTYFMILEHHNHSHIHIETTHEHKHDHEDPHHRHVHDPDMIGTHNHEHTHETTDHKHSHTPDMHHNHGGAK